MNTNVKQMWCGNCGGGEFLLYKGEGDNLMFAECKKCKSTSTIAAQEPSIVIGWGENSDGILYTK